MKALRCILLASVVLVTTQIEAVTLLNTYGFDRISSNSSENVEAQLSVKLWDLGGNQVRFDFFNNVGIASSIRGIYFDDSNLLAFVGLINSAGTDFSAGALKPPVFPGGGSLSPPFEVNDSISADRNNGNPSKGIDQSSESVQLIYNLLGGKTASDVVSDLATGALRIGLHVTSIGLDEDSDSFLNKKKTAPNVVPEPSTILLLGSGFIGFGLWARYRRRRQAEKQ